MLDTALTKRLSEDRTNDVVEEGICGKWLHSELDAIERATVLDD